MTDKFGCPGCLVRGDLRLHFRILGAARKALLQRQSLEYATEELRRAAVDRILRDITFMQACLAQNFKIGPRVPEQERSEIAGAELVEAREAQRQ